MKNAALALYHPHHPGKKVRAFVKSEPNKKKMFFIETKTKHPFKIDSACFGAFDYPPFEFQKGLVKTRVADDLAGVVIILSVLSQITNGKCVGLFTTAEETGFMGTLGFLRDAPIPTSMKFISLEASREMDGAFIGHGPVIRQGDRRILFDQKMTELIERAAKGKKYQKRVMTGGSCEASAFSAYGFKVSGMALPLGNYHNQKKNGRPGPEIIALKDLEIAVEILVQLFKDMGKSTASPSELFARLLEKELKKMEKYFLKKPSFEKISSKVKGTIK